LGRVRLKIDRIVSKNNNTDNSLLNNSLLDYSKTHHTQLDSHLPKTNTNIFSVNYNNMNNISNLSFSNLDQITEDIKVKESNFMLQNQLNNINKNYNCRICFRSESNIQDPLISPCKCSGSIKYIHFKCLKQCIDTKVTKKRSMKIIVVFFNGNHMNARFAWRSILR